MKSYPLNKRSILAKSMLLSAALSTSLSTYANSDLTTNDPLNIEVSSENMPAEGKVNIFDKSPYSKWLTFDATGWISYNFDRLVIINEYALTSANDAAGRDPKNWLLQGSTDGVNWFTLDNQNNQLFNTRYEKKQYEVNNPQAIAYVRFEVTENNGADILQLAELEFIGNDAATGNDLPLTDTLSLNKNDWQHYGPFTVNNKLIASTSGTGDTDLYLRKGAEATTKYYDCKSISPTSNESCELSGDNIYVSVHGYSDVTFTVNVNEEVENYNWQKPVVNFVDMNPETEGSKLLKRIINDPASHMAQRCIDVAKTLYTDSAESSRFHSLRFELREKDLSGNEFVAYKQGRDGSGAMTIAVSTSHLTRLYREAGNSDSAIKDEIDGILFHEVTHGYNNSPLTTDSYSEGGPFWAFTEGIADAVRISAGFHKTREPDVNGSRQWLGGYEVSGFFLHYVNEKIDPNFIRKFNQSANEMGNYTWSWDNAFQSITNRSVQDVWNEYKAFINNGGQLNY
ncbi:MAG: basic secretory protein-like protein [Cognaticolwellia aestuarii]